VQVNANGIRITAHNSNESDDSNLSYDS